MNKRQPCLGLILFLCLFVLTSCQRQEEPKALDALATQRELETVPTQEARDITLPTTAKKTTRMAPTTTAKKVDVTETKPPSEEDPKAKETQSTTSKEESATDRTPKEIIPGEAPVPLKEVSLEQPSGVDNLLTAEFFRQVSASPLYFNYREWTAPGDAEPKVKQEMLLLLKADQVYLKLTKDGVEKLIVKPADSAFYLLDNETYTAVRLEVNDEVAKQISSYAFSQLQASASKIQFTGTGTGDFHGIKASFEEFKTGEDRFARYYFDGNGIPLGHRTIEDGVVTSDIEIILINNEVDERFFEIPAIYQIQND